MEPALPTSAIPAGLAVPLSDADVARGGAKAPKVSVIIPARDEEANIGRCLRSILAQQGIAFQVIVVDDHSTDRTAEIARRLMAGGAGGTERVGGPYLPALANVGVEARSHCRRNQRRQSLSRLVSPLPAGWTGKANALCERRAACPRRLAAVHRRRHRTRARLAGCGRSRGRTAQGGSCFRSLPSRKSKAYASAR